MHRFSSNIFSYNQSKHTLAAPISILTRLQNINPGTGFEIVSAKTSKAAAFSVKAITYESASGATVKVSWYDYTSGKVTDIARILAWHYECDTPQLCVSCDISNN